MVYEIGWVGKFSKHSPECVLGPLWNRVNTERTPKTIVEGVGRPDWSIRGVVKMEENNLNEAHI